MSTFFRYSVAIRVSLYSLALLLLLSIAGCIRSNIDHVPESWPPPVAMAPLDQCPNITGLYVNRGNVTPEYKTLCFDSHSGKSRKETNKYPPKAGWNCDEQLSGNLIKMRAIEGTELQQLRWVDWLDIRQPDPDTLEVHFPQFDTKIFKRSKGDFQCDQSGLKYSISGSAFSWEEKSPIINYIATSMLVVFGYGTVVIVTTERIFSPLQDGSILMEVTESNTGAVILIPTKIKSHTFVRWERYSPEGEPRDQLSPFE